MDLPVTTRNRHKPTRLEGRVRTKAGDKGPALQQMPWGLPISKAQRENY